MEPYLGEIIIFGGNFAPKGWALCQGQLVAISQNPALFSLLGTFYGGNGTTNFALPDLRGRVAVHQGTGTGLSPYTIGETGGASSVTLLTTQLPAHTHGISASSHPGTQMSPNAAFIGHAERTQYGPGAAVALPHAVLTSDGGSQPHENRQPFLTISYIIAMTGVFPSRT